METRKTERKAGRAAAAVARRGAVAEEGEALAATLRDGPGDDGHRQRGGRRAATEATPVAAAMRVAPQESDEREEDAGPAAGPSGDGPKNAMPASPPVRDTTEGARGDARETDARAGPAAGTAAARDVSIPPAPPLPKETRGSPRPALQDDGEFGRRPFLRHMCLLNTNTNIRLASSSKMGSRRAAAAMTTSWMRKSPLIVQRRRSRVVSSLWL